MKKQGNIEFENSSGNVFDDLGIDNAEELQARGMVGFHVVELMPPRVRISTGNKFK